MCANRPAHSPIISLFSSSSRLTLHAGQSGLHSFLFPLQPSCSGFPLSKNPPPARHRPTTRCCFAPRAETGAPGAAVALSGASRSAASGCRGNNGAAAARWRLRWPRDLLRPIRDQPQQRRGGGARQARASHTRLSREFLMNKSKSVSCCFSLEALELRRCNVRSWSCVWWDFKWNFISSLSGGPDYK